MIRSAPATIGRAWPRWPQARRTVPRPRPRGCVTTVCPRAQPAHIRRDPGLVEDIENELHIAARRDRHIHPPHRGHRTVRHWRFLKHGSPDAHMNVNHDGKDIVVPSATNGSNTSHPRSLKSKGSSTLRKLNGPPTRTFAIRMSLYHLCQRSSTVITVVVGIRVLCIARHHGRLSRLLRRHRIWYCRIRCLSRKR